MGHIAFLLPGSPGALFTGDSLFIGGIGKLFEGPDAVNMTNTLSRFRSLPVDTRVYPGHEYTVQNLYFAAWLEPENISLQQKLRWAEAQRQVYIVFI